MYLQLYCSSSNMASILTQIEHYFEFKTPLVWRNVFLLTLGHLAAFYGLYLSPTAKSITIFWVVFCGIAGDTAISVGPHRLWTHRSYKAKLSMRIIIMLFYMLAGQYTIVTWVRDHRTHHKYADTDADPHSAARGLFYSHCGWLMMKRHPEHKEKGKVIDVSDVWQDPVIRFHQKHFTLLLLVIHVMFPSAVTYYVIGDTLKNSIFIGFFLRYLFSLNMLWCTNSLTHYWGYRPYNKNTRATENAFLAFALVGEGWHNFHHTFPWDYRVGEYGQGYQFSAYVIEMFAWLGLAYDLKTAAPELIRKVIAKQDLPTNYEVPETGLTDEMDNFVKEIKAA